MPYIKAADVTFLGLSSTVFCVECELISYNNSPKCLSCGSQVLLSLARILGGTLNGEKRASLISNDALDRVVKNLLGEVLPAEQNVAGNFLTREPAPNPTATLSRKSWALATFNENRGFNDSLQGMEIPIRAVLDRACTLTAAHGRSACLAFTRQDVMRGHHGHGGAGPESRNRHGRKSLCAMRKNGNHSALRLP